MSAKHETPWDIEARDYRLLVGRQRYSEQVGPKLDGDVGLRPDKLNGTIRAMPLRDLQRDLADVVSVLEIRRASVISMSDP